MAGRNYEFHLLLRKLSRHSFASREKHYSQRSEYSSAVDIMYCTVDLQRKEEYDQGRS